MFRIIALSALLALPTLQPGFKTLSILDAWNEQKTSPVKLVSVELYNQKIVSDKSFQASDDWIRDLKFTVQNVSDKSIKEITLRIEFSLNDQLYAYPISIGRPYFHVQSPIANTDELLLKPNQSVQFSFNTSNPANYQSFLSSRERSGVSVSEINKAKVYIVSAVFEDTKQSWYKGKFMERVSDIEWRIAGK
jgi:hypothetical protein